MTLRERLTAHIATEQAEIARLQADVTTNVARAQARLAVLETALAALTPEMETLLEQLGAIGVKVIE